MTRHAALVLAVLLAFEEQALAHSPPLTGSKRIVLVSGATGRTGSLLYKRLRAEADQHHGTLDVRALVRNATKAKDILGCSACDESEGIFSGDVTDAASLARAMKGADVLAIATASSPKCTGLVPIGPFGNCSYHKGAEPRAIDWLGTKAQVKAFAMAGGDLKSKQILYVSTMDTTVPNNFLDKYGNGFVSFYHLQAETSIMSSGIPFTITKACGLGDGSAGKSKLIVGHDDASFSLALNHVIQRDDVARILVEAILNPTLSAGLRFDVCASWNPFATATTDIANDVLKAARLPWDQRATPKLPIHI